MIVSDVQESFIWVRYKRNENQLIIFADDTYPRWVTTATLLDYDTVAGADKFGNICVVSLCIGVCQRQQMLSRNTHVCMKT